MVTTPQETITKQPVDLIGATTAQTIDPATGQLTGTVAPTVTTGRTTGTADVTPTDPAQARVTTTATDVRAIQPQERFGTISQNAIINAQQQATEDLNVRNVQANSRHRTANCISFHESFTAGRACIRGANAEQSAQFLEGIEAATGAPSSAATVQGQLTGLMTQFEGGTPPPWASGAMRQATAIMAQRGLVASSMAGQAIVQVMMESALPIALQDAQTVAQFEAQNLSNRQQRAMLA